MNDKQWGLMRCTFICLRTIVQPNVDESSGTICLALDTGHCCIIVSSSPSLLGNQYSIVYLLTLLIYVFYFRYGNVLQ